MEDERIYWVGFNLIKGIGTVRTRKLIDFFGHLSLAWGAPAETLKQAGLPEKSIEIVIQKRKLVDLNAVWDSINKKGI